MKKTISICAALLVVSALAAVSAAPAVALETTICEVEHPTSHECPSNQYPPQTYLGTGEAIFTSSPLSVACNAKIVFTTTASSGAPLLAKVTTLQISSCVDHGMTSCTASIGNSPFLGELSWSQFEIGSFKISPSGGGNPSFSFTCAATTCKYTVSVIPTTLIGGPTPPPPPIFGPRDDIEVLVSKTTGPCATTGTFGAVIEITSPTHLYVEQT